MLAYARSVIPHATFVAARAERLPFASASFDAVTCAQAFHWFDPQRALEEMRRVVRPGGTIAVWWKGLMRGDPVRHVREDIARELGSSRRATCWHRVSPASPRRRWRTNACAWFPWQAQMRVSRLPRVRALASARARRVRRAAQRLSRTARGAARRSRSSPSAQLPALSISRPRPASRAGRLMRLGLHVAGPERLRRSRRLRTRARRASHSVLSRQSQDVPARRARRAGVGALSRRCVTKPESIPRSSTRRISSISRAPIPKIVAGSLRLLKHDLAGSGARRYPLRQHASRFVRHAAPRGRLRLGRRRARGSARRNSARRRPHSRKLRGRGTTLRRYARGAGRVPARGRPSATRRVSRHRAFLGGRLPDRLAGRRRCVHRARRRDDRLERVHLFHFNDTQVPLGGHRDRHWHIGEGFIGYAGFRALASRPELRDKTAILETPGEPSDDARNLQSVRLIFEGALT